MAKEGMNGFLSTLVKKLHCWRMGYIHGIYPDMAIEIWGKQRFQPSFNRVSSAAGFSKFSDVSAAGSRDDSSLAEVHHDLSTSHHS